MRWDVGISSICCSFQGWRGSPSWRSTPTLPTLFEASLANSRAATISGIHRDTTPEPRDIGGEEEPETRTWRCQGYPEDFEISLQTRSGPPCASAMMSGLPSWLRSATATWVPGMKVGGQKRVRQTQGGASLISPVLLSDGNQRWVELNKGIVYRPMGGVAGIAALGTRERFPGLIAGTKRVEVHFGRFP